MTLDDARAALNLVDDAPDPERTAEARSELKVLDEALADTISAAAGDSAGLPCREGVPP